MANDHPWQKYQYNTLFSPDSQLVLTFSKEDKVIELWQIETGSKLLVLDLSRKRPGGNEP